jgi:ABC-2 type transport system permease protein
MTPFRAFLRKEIREVFRTWRIWVLPGLMLFFALTSPVIALLTPQLVASMAQTQPGVEITFPDPTALDSYRLFLKNLDQLGMLALIITSASAVAAERRNGTAVLVLTKPLERSGFIVVKIVVQQVMLVIITAIGAVLCALLTLALFPGPQPAGFFPAVGLWLLFALMMIGAMTLFSVMLPTQGAAGVGLLLLFGMVLAGLWSPLTRHSFIGLSSAANTLLGGGRPELIGPVLTGIAAAVGFSALAIVKFRRVEL